MYMMKMALSLYKFLALPAFFAQGDTFEEAHTNLRDVIEGNVMLALQLGWAIPVI